jgi:serine/threonine protein kinase
VTPFYSQGTLASQLHRFAGKPVEALRAFRSLVAGVAELHRQRIVHRDIKPENIFVESDRLILGDFGIAYVDDAGKTRVTDTYENVGSRDWMPAWAMGMRIDDIRASFDVFSLGKVLWAMVSGKTKMRLWYWERPEFNLQEQFPKDDRMPWINQLLRGSVREDEEHIGWRDAAGLLNQCDSILTILQRGGQVFARGVNRICRVCGNGIYELAARENNHTGLRNLGFDPAGEKLRVFQCTNCGHLDIFRVTSNPPAWRTFDAGR